MLKSWVARIPSARASRTWEIVFRAATLVVVGAGAIVLVLAGAITASLIMVLAAILVMSTLAALAATVLGRLASFSGQHARDLEAQAILETLRSGDAPPPYTLYLRPFASTDVFDESRLIAIPAGARPGASGGFIAPPERFELEGQITQAVKPFAPLVALGAPLEHLGAGRILVGDHEWREAIGLLMRGARLIILLPSSREGTLWEVGQLLDTDLIERAVVVDPPNGSVKGVDFDHAAEWDAIRNAFAARGYALPDDDPKGLLVFFGDEKEPQNTHRLDITEASRLRSFFKAAMGLR